MTGRDRAPQVVSQIAYAGVAHMAEPFDVLDFVDVLAFRGHHERSRRFHDYVISGVRLSTMVAASDNIGVFGWLGEPAQGAFARQLLGEEASPLAPGRVAIFVCAECGDLGCQCVSARLVEERDSVTWTDFGFEADYDPGPKRIMDVRPLRFAKEPYRAAIRRVAAMATLRTQP